MLPSGNGNSRVHATADPIGNLRAKKVLDRNFNYHNIL